MMTVKLKRTFPLLLGVATLIASTIIWTGCATTGSSSTNDALTEVIGTWTYEASGSQPLSRGVFQLAATNGRLIGRLRDSELGTMPLHVNVSGKRLELRMDVFRFGTLSVAGSVEGDQFRGLVDQPTYDVSMSADETSRARRSDFYGSFRAERRGVPAIPEIVLNCPRLGPDGIQTCR
jgi:hypothetical protein